MTKRTTDAKQWYTVLEAAQKLGVSRGRVSQLITEGRIAVWRPTGTANLISSEELGRFAALPRLPGAAGHLKK
jgi:excisionase family DNA binding protein